MKVSFKGNYVLKFNDSESKNKALKYFNKKAFDELKDAKFISDMKENVPVVRNLSSNEILILTGQDAKDYSAMRKLNVEKNSPAYPIKKFIKEEYFDGVLMAAYAETAKIMDFDTLQSKDFDIFA